jgi:hypothetical protein
VLFRLHKNAFSNFVHQACGKENVCFGSDMFGGICLTLDIKIGRIGVSCNMRRSRMMAAALLMVSFSASPNVGTS